MPNHLPQPDRNGPNQGEGSFQLTGTKEGQKTPMIHQNFKLLPTIHQLILVNHLTTPQLDKCKYPVDVEQDVQQGFKGTECGLQFGSIHEYCDPYKVFVLKFDYPDLSLGASLSQSVKNYNELNPVTYLAQSVIQAKKS